MSSCCCSIPSAASFNAGIVGLPVVLTGTDYFFVEGAALGLIRRLGPNDYRADYLVLIRGEGGRFATS